jgi:rare lipoprotein A
MKNIFTVLSLSLVLLLGACTEAELASHVIKSNPVTSKSKSQGSFKVGNPYKIKGKTYTPQEDYHLIETGIASWYGPNFHGKQTANGEIFDQNELTAAHRTLQMPSLVRVVNLENGRSVVVRVNDRGPFSSGRIIDLSKKAAELLGFKNQGTAKVRIEVLTRESKALSQMARSGQDTSGYEIAHNQKPSIQKMSFDQNSGSYVKDANTYHPTTAPAPIQTSAVQRETLAPKTSINSPTATQNPRPLTGHSKNGAFYPDAVVETVAVQKTGIYVQAGSFGVEGNAARLASTLKAFGDSGVHTDIANGLHRVRLGPIKSVAEADRILSELAANGYKDTLIIVE